MPALTGTCRYAEKMATAAVAVAGAGAGAAAAGAAARQMRPARGRPETANVLPAPGRSN